MQVNGITWHASVMDAETFTAMNTLATGALGLTPMMEMPGVAVFAMADGSILELYEESSDFRPA